MTRIAARSDAVMNVSTGGGLGMSREERLRVEDSLFIGPGELTPSNSHQVTKIRPIVESLGHLVATPAEARERLGLKGADRVSV